MEKYLNDITYIHHVIHTPSIRTLIDEIYDRLTRQEETHPGDISLLCSIVASATYCWTARDNPFLFSSLGQANNQSTLWVKAALDLLDYSRRKACGSTKDVQAMIILSFVISSLEGVSRRYRDLLSMAAMLARNLSLHRIDDPSYTRPTGTPLTTVQAEIGRRLWWYLAATDWYLLGFPIAMWTDRCCRMFSRYAGPQEGTYSINPNHMMVDEPMNINDEDLRDGADTVELPIHQPTSMSYFLQRIRLAEICRDLTDKAPLANLRKGLSWHDEAMQAETKLQQFIQNLPAFFLLGGNNTAGVAQADIRDAPGIVVQRYVLNSLLYAQRCKLHIKDLGPDLAQPNRVHSREICLDSARHIIKTEQLLAEEDIPFSLIRLKFSGVLYCVFMASVVLLLNICLNKRLAKDNAHIMEVAEALSVIEEAVEQSERAVKLLDLLKAVAHKYHVDIPSLKEVRARRLHNLGKMGNAQYFEAQRSIDEPVRTSDQFKRSHNSPSTHYENLPFEGYTMAWPDGMDFEAMFSGFHADLPWTLP